ncbi:MAG: hypothetical protein WCH61_04355, partial [bacterium]
PQLFSPKPPLFQVPATVMYKIDPEQKLCLLVFKLLPEHLNAGENRIWLRVTHRQAYPLCTTLTVEKLEVHVAYR